MQEQVIWYDRRADQGDDRDDRAHRNRREEGTLEHLADIGPDDDHRREERDAHDEHEPDHEFLNDLVGAFQCQEQDDDPENRADHFLGQAGDDRQPGRAS